MVIFFNVKAVRDYLVKHGHVYTLRKPRKRVGKDTAVHGSRFKHETIAPVTTEDKGLVYSSHQLLPYVEESGLYDPNFSKIGNAIKWQRLAQHLSGNHLRLYHVEVRT